MTLGTTLESIRVLVVDDVSADRVIVRDMLEELGICQVTEAADGDEALRLIQQQEFELVITDIKMPNLSGKELLRMTRQQSSTSMLPFIMMTSLSDVVPIKAALSPNRTAWLMKPLRFQVFTDTVKQLLTRWYRIAF